MKLHISILSANSIWLVCALLSPAMAANAIVETTTDTDSVVLSNLDTQDSQETPVADIAGPAAQPTTGVMARLRNATEAGQGLAVGGNATAGSAPRPTRAELAATAQPDGAHDAESRPAQQQYQDLMLKQASFNGGPNGNLASARKYLRVDRESFVNAVKN